MKVESQASSRKSQDSTKLLLQGPQRAHELVARGTSGNGGEVQANIRESGWKFIWKEPPDLFPSFLMQGNCPSPRKRLEFYSLERRTQRGFGMWDTRHTRKREQCNVHQRLKECYMLRTCSCLFHVAPKFPAVQRSPSRQEIRRIFSGNFDQPKRKTPKHWHGRSPN